MGAANLAAGFFQGFPISSSSSRTPVAEAPQTVYAVGLNWYPNANMRPRLIASRRQHVACRELSGVESPPEVV